MLLPSIAWGRLEEAPVSGAVCPAPSCVHCLAPSLATALLPAARTKMKMPMCSSPRLGTAPVAELNVPPLTPGWTCALRDGPGMSWRSCDCGNGACFLGALSLPSSRGTWNVLLVTGLLAAALARGCR